MRLYWSSRSPYARKVTIVAHELGVFDRIELIPAVVTLRTAPPLPGNVNPLGQVPTLVDDAGAAWFDSTVICEKLCLDAGDARLVPPGAAGLETRRRNALAGGLLDNLIRRYSERRRAVDGTDTDYAVAADAKIARVLDGLGADAAGWGDRFDLGHAAIVTALGYIDFRFAPDWRADRPALARWFADAERRPSVIGTAHAD